MSLDIAPPDSSNHPDRPRTEIRDRLRPQRTAPAIRRGRSAQSIRRLARRFAGPVATTLIRNCPGNRAVWARCVALSPSAVSTAETEASRSIVSISRIPCKPPSVGPWRPFLRSVFALHRSLWRTSCEPPPRSRHSPSESAGAGRRRPLRSGIIARARLPRVVLTPDLHLLAHDDVALANL